MQSQTPIFQTTTTWMDRFSVLIQLILAIGITVFWFLKTSKIEWGSILFLYVFISIWVIQALRSNIVFRLFSDRLEVNRPFFFISPKPKVFPVTELKEVIFRRVKGRYGGPHVIVYSKELDDSYRIDFSKETMSDFVNRLTDLGVKVSLDNM